MRIGMIGLGRMGGNMTARLREGGHEVVGYDRNSDVTEVASPADLVAALDSPRAIWLMVPAGAPTQSTITDLAALLQPGDVIVDGGNSYFRDTIARAAELSAQGIALLDAGVSGGIWGLKEGFCLMVGGDADAFARVEPAMRTLAPDDGLRHVGPSGSGHFVKMIHNGIEYGMLQAYAEGFEILRGSRDFPELDLPGVAGLWRRGSVIRSWLLDLAEIALSQDPNLDRIDGYVQDSGEGRWTIIEAINEGVPAPVTSAALFARFASRQDDSFAMKLVAALRREFGGHGVQEK